MPRIDHLLETALYVEDLDAAIAFYRQLFDFALLERGERLAVLDVGRQQVLLLCRRGASAGLPVTAHDARGRQHVAFAIPAAELELWERRLGESGVRVEERRAWERGGRSLYFRDPDGHLLELATPGTWSTY